MSDFEKKGTEQKWEREILDPYAGKLVDAAEVSHHQSEYILCLSFWDVNELIDLDPEPGGLYVYSSSEAYSKEQRIDHERLGNWLAAFGMAVVELNEEKGYHASGHITGPDLLKVIEAISPQILLPVPTQKPGFFLESARGRAIS
jgi:ribonuclease J